MCTTLEELREVKQRLERALLERNDFEARLLKVNAYLKDEAPTHNRNQVIYNVRGMINNLK